MQKNKGDKAMIIFTEWDLSVIIESHLNKNPFYHSLSDELQNKIINMVYDYVINVDIPSNILFEKLRPFGILFMIAGTAT